MKTKIVNNEGNDGGCSKMHLIKTNADSQITMAVDGIHYPVSIGSYKARRIAEWLQAAADEIDKSKLKKPEAPANVSKRYACS